jgi:cytochrome P450
VEIGFDDPGFLRDPYPGLARLREQAPVSWHAGSGRWLAASHAAVDAVLRDRRLGRFWRDREPSAFFEPFNLLHRNQMMENEPPAHSRLRSLVAQAFGRGHVERLRPAVAAQAGALAAAAGPRFDLLADVAEPRPTATRPCSAVPIPPTRAAVPTRTSASAPGCTSASAHRWPASNCRRRSPPCSITRPPWRWPLSRFTARRSSCGGTLPSIYEPGERRLRPASTRLLRGSVPRPRIRAGCPSRCGRGARGRR